MRETLVVIPTYNEAESITAVITAALEAEPRADVLVVDDNSPDGTGDLVADLAAVNPRVSLLRRPGKMGMGRAYIDGFRWALNRGYRFVAQMDADFSHDPADLPRLVSACDMYDAVIGSRYVPGGAIKDWPLSRRALSRGGCFIARTLLHLGVMDVTTGYRCYRADTLAAIDLDSVQAVGFAFQIEMTYRVRMAGLSIAEIPITFVDRRQGTSKLSGNIVWESMMTVLRLRREGLLRGPARRRSDRWLTGTPPKTP